VDYIVFNKNITVDHARALQSLVTASQVCAETAVSNAEFITMLRYMTSNTLQELNMCACHILCELCGGTTDDPKQELRKSVLTEQKVQQILENSTK